MSNVSVVQEFVLLGFSHLHEFQILLFAFILLIYVLTVLGNLAIITLTCLDSRLHSPMYFFLCNSSLMEMLVTSTVVPRMLADLLSSHKTMTLAECLTQSFFLLLPGLHQLPDPHSHGLRSLRGHLPPSALRNHHERPRLCEAGAGLLGGWLPFHHLPNPTENPALVLWP